ncbi:MAG TPA: pentapeptide repeat-containing protein [Chromatiales bacterium]|nr:pentapeptide repeat-containing protein [Chromatiales bacterium]
MKPLFTMAGASAIVGVLLGLLVLPPVFAWTKEIDKLKDVNQICEWKPESQCSWAVRIGVSQPGVDMHGASMASMRLDQANLQGANLEDAILQLASLEDANLMLANLKGAHLHGVNFRGANLSLADLSGANLLDADLSDANLRGANLSGAIPIKARFDNAIWTDGRRCAPDSIGICRQAEHD